MVQGRPDRPALHHPGPPGDGPIPEGGRLRSFLEILPPHHRYPFELRDPDWVCPEAYQILAEHEPAFCIYDFHGRQSPTEVTADFVYVRLHDPYDAYRGKYDTETLSGWAGAFATWTRQGKDVYCYFDVTTQPYLAAAFSVREGGKRGYAVQNAMALEEMTGRGE